MTFKDNLNRYIKAIQEDSNYDLEEFQELITEAPIEDIRSSSKLFIQLCRLLTDALVKSKRSVSGIHLIFKAIAKFQTRRHQLTPLHSSLCLLCLDAKCFNPALELLDIDYTEIKKTDDKDDDNKHVLLFYYYGGLIYAAMKNFERAMFYMEIVVTMPASHMSPVMQEAYKKYIILNLLIHGKLRENLLPRYTSLCVSRQRKQLGQTYLKLAQEYVSLNYEKIRLLVYLHASTFERDENMGLIRQCLTQVHRRNIQRLTKTFITLPLRDVATHVGLSSEKEAEMYILNMIDDGEISAKINQKDGMVVFQDDCERYDSVAVFHQLQEDTSTTIELINTLKNINNDDYRSSCVENPFANMSDIQ